MAGNSLPVVSTQLFHCQGPLVGTLVRELRELRSHSPGLGQKKLDCMHCCPLLQSSLWGKPAVSYDSCLIEKPAWQGIEISLWSINLTMWGAQFNSLRSWILSTNMAWALKQILPSQVFSLPQHLDGYSARDLETEEPIWSPHSWPLKIEITNV